MKKLFVLGILSLIVLLGCNLFTRDFSVGEDLSDPTKGSVILILNGGSLPTKTIAPVNMDVDYYDVNFFDPGLDPATDPPSYTQQINPTVTLGILELTGLATTTIDPYSVTVEAYNYGPDDALGGGDDRLIGAIGGVAGNPITFNIVAGQSTAVLVDVSPLSGNGDLSIKISWPDGAGVNEELTTDLTPTVGALTLVRSELNIGTDKQERDYFNDDLPTGYYTLIMRLYERDSSDVETDLLWGWVEAVRIIESSDTEDALTEGTFDLTTLSGGAGAVGLDAFMQVEITFDSPAPTEADGSTPISDLNSVGPANGLIVTAATDPADPGTGPDAYTYAWYLDGSPETDGLADSVFNFAADDVLLTEGAHNLSVVVTTAGGSLSSNTISFTVVP